MNYVEADELIAKNWNFLAREQFPQRFLSLARDLSISLLRSC